MATIILASQSPRRQELLKLIVDDFDIQTADTKEFIDPMDEPHVAVMTLAFEKAKTIANQTSEGNIVIAADTMVYADQYLGKPQDENDAYRMLKDLSGSEHLVVTGYCIFKAGTDKKIVDYNATRVKFKALTDQEIWDYIASGEPMDKAGAYGIQGRGALFIEAIYGDYYSVMGLPVQQVNTTLKQYFI